MAQTGFTPLSLYYSATTTNVPLAADLVAGELALNTADGKLFYKDSSGVVQVLGTKGGVGSSSTTQVLYNSSGLVVGSANMTFNGTVLTSSFAGPVAATTLSASSTVSGTGFSTYLASPPAIGGTAAAAGAFTTLTTSSTVTLSGGTANGVTYLNASKVLTSGTALTFDGTNLAVGGTSSARLDVAGWIRSNAATSTPSTGAGVEIGFPATTPWYGATPSGLVQAYDRTASAYLPLGFSGLNFAFAVSGTEQMRLTSTGLGIGTSSPSAKLEVAGSIKGTGTAATAINGLFLTGTTTQWNRVLVENTSGSLMLGTDGSTPVWGGAAYAGVVGTNGSTPLQFMTTGQLRATLDTSGNLGLGVVPNAWISGYKALQIGATGALWQSASGFTFLSDNSYTDSGSINRYITTNGASLYRQNAGSHNWFSAPSGTAGTAITFTQAMTLTAAGNLGIGTTSPSSRLSSVGNSATDFKALTLRNSNGATGSAAVLNFEASSGTEGDISSSAAQIKGIRTGAGTSGALAFWTSNSGVSAEGMRLDASGNLGLGVTPSAWGSPFKAIDVSPYASFAGTTSGAAVVVQNAYYNGTNYIYRNTDYALRYTQGSGVHAWAIAPSGTAGAVITFTQAMTLTAAGDLLVGVTSANANGGVLQLKSGITFPATAVAATDANTLDDYEEGTWTPTPNSGTFSTATGKYVKIGSLVTLTFNVIVGTAGGSTMTAPFNADATAASGIYTSLQTYGVGTTAPTIVIGTSSATIYFRSVGSAVAFSSMTLTAGATLYGSISYYTNA